MKAFVILGFAALFPPLSLYLAGSFGAATFDISQWGGALRGSITILGMYGMIAGVGLAIVHKDMWESK